MSGVLINPYRFAAAASGASLVTSISANGSANTVTTGSANTTGANFIVAGASYYRGVTPSPVGALTDSKSNTWTQLTLYSSGSSELGVVLFYCYAPSVGTGHTFTFANSGVYPSIFMLAFSGMSSSPFDVENGAVSASAATQSTGSVTPSQANSVLVSLVGHYDNSSGAVSIDSGFTKQETQAWVSNSGQGGAIAYKILTSASATNPTWTITNAARVCAAIAAFKY